MCRDQRDDRRDVICDSFAMIKASHEGDDEAFASMLKMADLKSCCEFLAQVCEDLIGHVAADLDTEPADLIGRLRARQLREW